MKVIIASDHAGFDYKNILLKDIQQQGYEVTDIGTFSNEPDDYPDRAAEVANAILYPPAVVRVPRITFASINAAQRNTVQVSDTTKMPWNTPAGKQNFICITQAQTYLQ